MPKKDRIITITINPRHHLKSVAYSLPEPLFDKLQAVLKERCRDLRTHWRKDGWNLSYRCIEEGVLAEVFGHHLAYYILGRLLKTGCVWQMGKGQFGAEPMLVKEATSKRGRMTYKIGKRKRRST